VLLLNDRFDPNWKVFVDGQTAPLLRCNFLMRGVFLQPGPHKVEFKFQPPVGALYLSLAAIGCGVALLGVVLMPTPEAKSQAQRQVKPQTKTEPLPPSPIKEPAATAKATIPKPANQPKRKKQGAKSKR
jgi:hypothetical protein